MSRTMWTKGYGLGHAIFGAAWWKLGMKTNTAVGRDFFSVAVLKPERVAIVASEQFWDTIDYRLNSLNSSISALRPALGP